MEDLDVLKELEARFIKVWKELYGFGPDVIMHCRFQNLAYRLKEIEYVNLNPIAETPERLDSIVYRNDSDEKDLQTWKTSRTKTNTFTYEFQEGLKLGTKFKVSFPLFTSNSGEVSSELSFSAKQSTTTSTSSTWSVDTQINMPPRSKVTTTLWVSKGIFDTPFTATVEAIGSTHVTLYSSTHGFGLMYLSLNFLSSDQRTFTARGRFTGGMGTHIRIDKKQESLKSNRAREEARQLSIAKIKRQPDKLNVMKMQDKKLKPTIKSK
jgi:hypothetical protein